MVKLSITFSLFLTLFFTQQSFAQFDSADFIKTKKLQITRITPDGKDVPAGRQIVIQFNRPVVPIGKMERKAEEIPITIEPKLKCRWRWINTSALACQLDQDNVLKQSTKYSITINPGIKTEDGDTIEKAYQHSFITLRPQARYAWFINWQSPGTPIIGLNFNQQVIKSSVEKYINFSYQEKSRNIKVEKYKHDNEKPAEVNGEEARRIWQIQPLKKLPLDTNTKLKVSPGIVSAFGTEKGIEERAVVTFDTFPKFKFLGLSCSTNEHKKILINKENYSEIGKCNPLNQIGLSFSSPVLKSEIKKHIIINPDLAGNRKDYDPWARYRDYSKLYGPHKKDRVYTVWFPEILKAAEKYSISSKPAKLTGMEVLKSILFNVRPTDLVDEFGRHLKKPIKFDFWTDHRLPNFELVHKTAVLEKQIDSELPLYITNLDQVNIDYKNLTPSEQKVDQSFTISDIPDVEDIQFAIPMQIRKMLEGKSGAIYGQLSTVPAVTKSPFDYYHTFFSVITPYQVHVKIGHYNTLVWVSDLETGGPVSNAKVQIYKDAINKLSSNFDVIDQATTDQFGLSLLKGTKDLDPQLNFPRWCSKDDCEYLFVRIDKDNEMALMPLNNRFNVDIYRASNRTIWPWNKKKYGHIYAWGTSAQGVYRLGDTMQYKFYVRDQDKDTYVPAPKKTYKLEIVGPSGKTVHEVKDITLSEFGSYSGEYIIPKNASVGWYDFKLTSDFTKDHTWYPLGVLVSDFTPAPFKVSNSLNGDLFYPEQEVEISSQAKLHSGGAYTQAASRVTANLKASRFSSKHPIASDFKFDTYKNYILKRVFQKLDQVNDQGELNHKFVLPKENIVYGKLNVETAIRDERGKYITGRSNADYIAVDRLVGLRNTKWLYKEDQKAIVEYIVVDPKGEPVAGTDVNLKIELLESKAAKVKGAGNAYLTNYIDTWIKAGDCKGQSKKEASSCEFVPEKLGSYKITANINDTKGNQHSTELHAWVTGKGQVVWHSPKDNSLPIIPEKSEYKIGNTARYLIKNPFQTAQALITIERYGVIKSWVQTLEGGTPVIEFEIEKDFIPGFYLSVVAFSPRVAEPPKTPGQIDLGKPTYKIAYVKVPVKDPYKQIDVELKTDAEIYKPRDTVKLDIHAEAKHKDKQEKIEIAVAVLDEAVLDLVRGGKNYFDPYQGFYNLDSLDLQNYSLLTRLIGLQKFEKKGANPGGGGLEGASDIDVRSIFKYVSYWNPSIQLNSKGNAKVEFEVPDNLTGWRVLAVAVTPSDRFGLGDTNFKVNRPTEVRPAMPNQVTEGDDFTAAFSVMNRTEHARKVKVQIQAEGNLKTIDDFIKEINLEPYKRQTVYLPIQTTAVKQNRDIAAGKIDFIVKAGDQIDSDGIKHSIPVYKRRSLETAANYGTTTKNEVSENLLFPDKIYPDVGAVSISLSSSVIANIEGAFRYLKDYPYTCWEQRLSKGVMAAHYQNLKAYLPDDLEWDQSKTLPQNTLDAAANYQAPNGGMTYFIPQDYYVSPYLSAYTALAFNWLKASKYQIPKTVEDKLHQYLIQLLKKDVLPTFYSRGMSSTVRAVALAALAQHEKINLSDLERYRSHVQYMSLFGKAHYLQAATEIKGAEEIRTEVADLILAHANQSGGKFTFNEELDGIYARILASPARANCSILSSLLIYAKDSSAANLVQDIPFKLVRSITARRGNRDHWENTQENIFCINSLVEYSRIYEKTTPNMQIDVSIDSKQLSKTKLVGLQDSVTVNRPITAEDPGKKRQVKIKRSGDGRLYYATRMSYAPLDDHADRLNAGIDIRKEYSVERDDNWILLKNPNEIKRGELVRVDIYLSLPTGRNFVVVEDPLPGGLETVNRDLANTSMIDADKGAFKAAGGAWWFQFDDWFHYSTSRWSFYHRELRHDSARFYSDYLPAGNYHLSYTAQAIAEGEFNMLPVHAEEMYEPDVFGKGLAQKLIVTSE